MAWTVPEIETSPPEWESPGLTSVDEAIVTPFARGRLLTGGGFGPSRWITGAVYTAEGRLLPPSQRRWLRERHDPVAADPELVPVPVEVRRLRGTWLYAGHWSEHFGHFLLETLPNLWPDPASLGSDLRGVLAHRAPRGRVPPATQDVRLKTPDLKTWQQDLLDLAGYGGAALRVVHSRPVRVQRLLVPVRPVLLKRWVQSPAVELWRRISTAVGAKGPQRRVYLSRSDFHASSGRNRTEAGWADFLDTVFAEAGFAVIHPETMSMREQVTAVRGAEVLAGLSGSAMHLSAFAEKGTKVLSIGDNRVPDRPVGAQVTIDAACGHLTAFVANHDRDHVLRLLGSLNET